MNAIVPVAQPSMPMADMMQLARAIAQSGLFGMKTPDQALALMSIAQAEGRHPALAARDYDIIQGRPAKKAEAMMRDFIQAGGKVEWHALTDERADATFTHPQTGSVRIDWDMKRAAVAGLASKDNWKKTPRAMLRSRVVSEGVRTIWPLATSGMYVPEEVSDFTGKTIDGAAETPPDLHQAINDEVPLKAAAAAAPRAERKVGQAVYDAAPAEKPERTDEQWRAWLDKLRAACTVLRRRDEVVEVANRPSVGDAIATGPEFVRREISAILAENYARFPEEPSDDLDEVAIVGEDKIAAG